MLYRMRSDARSVIERAGLSQAELARRAGLSKYSIRAWLAGDRPARGASAWSVARVVAGALGISDDQALAMLWEEAGEE